MLTEINKEIYNPQLQYGGKLYRPGVHYISNEEYHASVGISRSSISEIKKSPLHFWESYLNPVREKRSSTKEMTMGNALHTLILEPELYDEQFIVAQKVDGRTKEGKRYQSELAVAAIGRQVLNVEDCQQIANMVEAVQSHPLAEKLLKGARNEESFYWIDSETDILCKARPDSLNGNKIIDLKTTEDATLSAFVGSAKKYNYHIQAAMQIDAIKETLGLSIEHFIMIAIPKKAPYKPYIYRMGDEEIELGRREYKDALKIIRSCFDKNRWDLDRDTVIDLNFNSYTLNTNVLNNLIEVYI